MDMLEIHWLKTTAYRLAFLFMHRYWRVHGYIQTLIQGEYMHQCNHKCQHFQMIISHLWNSQRNGFNLQDILIKVNVNCKFPSYRELRLHFKNLHKKYLLVLYDPDQSHEYMSTLTKNNPVHLWDKTEYSNQIHLSALQQLPKHYLFPIT